MDNTLNTIISAFSSEEIPIGSICVLGTDSLIHQWDQEAGGEPIGIVLKTYQWDRKANGEPIGIALKTYRPPELPIYILEVALFNEYADSVSCHTSPVGFSGVYGSSGSTVAPGAWTTWSSASIGLAGTCTGNINAKTIGESASSAGVSTPTIEAHAEKPKSDKSPSYDGDGSRWEDIAQEKNRE